MVSAKKRGFTVPKGADEKLLRRKYESALAKRQKRFKEEYERFALVQKLKAEALREAAKAAGARPASVSKEAIAQARAVLSKLRKRRPAMPPTLKGHNPVLYPPYTMPWPAQYYSGGGNIEFVPWDGAPNASTGQVGSVLAAWGGGDAIASFSVGVLYFLPAAGTYQVTVTAYISGIYYLYAPGPYQPAIGLLGLSVEADDYEYYPAYEPRSTTTVTSQVLIYGGRDWNYISGQYYATVQFPAGDAPAWYMLAAGTTQEIFAATGCIAAVDAYTTIQSIDVEML
jgi:hypothetical protein